MRDEEDYFYFADAVADRERQIPRALRWLLIALAWLFCVAVAIFTVAAFILWQAGMLPEGAEILEVILAFSI